MTRRRPVFRDRVRPGRIDVEAFEGVKGVEGVEDVELLRRRDGQHLPRQWARTVPSRGTGLVRAFSHELIQNPHPNPSPLGDRRWALVPGCWGEVGEGSGWWRSGARVMVANLANLAKMANMAGAGRDSIFTIVLGTGGKHPEPAAPAHALLGARQAVGGARRMVGILADVPGGGSHREPRGDCSGRVVAPGTCPTHAHDTGFSEGRNSP